MYEEVLFSKLQKALLIVKFLFFDYVFLIILDRHHGSIFML